MEHDRSDLVFRCVICTDTEPMCGEIAAVKVKIPLADFDFAAAPISPLVGVVAMSGDAQGVGERRRQELTGGQGNSDLSG